MICLRLADLASSGSLARRRLFRVSPFSAVVLAVYSLSFCVRCCIIRCHFGVIFHVHCAFRYLFDCYLFRCKRCKVFLPSLFYIFGNQKVVKRIIVYLFSLVLVKIVCFAFREYQIIICCPGYRDIFLNTTFVTNGASQ